MITPSSFPNDPKGWLGNQAGHILIGIGLSIWLSALAWRATGELPMRSSVFLVILLGYFLFEILSQRWAGADTLEDTIFVAVYGAGSALATFSEVSVGELKVAGEIDTLATFMFVIMAHLAFGAWLRRG